METKLNEDALRYQHPRFREDAKQWALLVLALGALIGAVKFLHWMGV